MLRFFTLLLVCQLAGEVPATLLLLPVPGPVMGMGLLFIGLLWHGRVPDELDQLASGLLRHLGLLFVPAGVGVILYLDLLAEAWLPIAGALLLGTAFTMAVTGLIMQRLAASSTTPAAPDDHGPDAP